MKNVEEESGVPWFDVIFCPWLPCGVSSQSVILANLSLQYEMTQLTVTQGVWSRVKLHRARVMQTRCKQATDA